MFLPQDFLNGVCTSIMHLTQKRELIVYGIKKLEEFTIVFMSSDVNILVKTSICLTVSEDSTIKSDGK